MSYNSLPAANAVRSRAPLRVGFAGGGTDLSPFCDSHGGQVMNATVRLYAYAHISPRTDGSVCFESAELNDHYSSKALSKLPVSQGTMLLCGVYNRIVSDFNKGAPLAVNVKTTVDVPAGSGMGGSSALVVALIEAYKSYLRLPLGEYEIAQLAYEIEREDLGISGGKQDQYAAAFGGFNFMEFYENSRTIINPLRIKSNTVNELEASLILYYTGRSRNSANIIDAQVNEIRKQTKVSLDALLALKQEAVEMKEALVTGQLSRLAEILSRGWQAKKQTAEGVSNPEIDRILDLALSNGALAGKVSGAGGGGFVLILTKPTERYRVIEALSREPGRVLPVVFTNEPVSSWRQTL